MVVDKDTADVEMTETSQTLDTGNVEPQPDNIISDPTKVSQLEVSNMASKTSSSSPHKSNKKKNNKRNKSKQKKDAPLQAKIEDKKEARKRKIAEKKSFKQGVPLSGKWWKDNERKKFSSIKNNDLKISRNLALIQAQRAEKKFLLEHKRNAMAEKEAEREKKREKRKINQIRTLENQLKSEKLQIIRNPHTIKNMKRNQRKSIETRDLSLIKPQNIQN
ncbi:coiled-coil domain-containing protein 86 [Hyalella azteca]|uniref:Coiled-coil domain-containing protein 86 n=1 Tax=Hyalella azteca TaxID=294128 RepID=A0A8B7N621_HYAAZ|nr:coiled-coil domain-containing protein 86 [Hyalella azteca]